GVGSTLLTFAPGVTAQHFHVLVNGDTKVEPNEQFFVNLSGATNATIADNQGVGTITNDDTKANQTITVNTHAPASAPYNSQFTVSATASSGLAVAYSSSGSCTNVGATFTMTSSTGTCTVMYDQAGDSNYNAAPQVIETVNAQKANQTITVNTHAPANAAYNSQFTVSETGRSALTVR